MIVPVSSSSTVVSAVAERAVAPSSLRRAGIQSIVILSADSETLVSFRGHLVDRLRADGISVGYVGPAVDDTTRDWLTSRAVEIRVIPISRNTLAPLADFRTFFFLVRVLRSMAPDAVITTRIKTSVYGLLAAALVGVRFRFAFVTGLGYAFIDRQGDRRWQYINWVAHLLYGVGLRRATAVAFQNTDDERDFRKWRLVPDIVPSAIVNGSGVDTTHYKMMPLPDQANCLFVGRLLTDKGLGELIEAARIVKLSRSDVVITIVGPAETNPSAFPMERLQAAIGEGVVEYAGAASDVRPFLAACRIFVLPSYREGTPRSILEAMSTGRPIVTTDVPGCRDTVEAGRNGLIVPARDAQSLAAAILELVKDPDRAARMGQESRKIAEEKYEVQKVTHDLLNFYGGAALRHGE
jgi:glycosyltransferase involved in cell wall biosynthesis